jgi:hypothetical protein
MKILSCIFGVDAKLSYWTKRRRANEIVNSWYGNNDEIAESTLFAKCCEPACHFDSGKDGSLDLNNFCTATQHHTDKGCYEMHIDNGSLRQGDTSNNDEETELEETWGSNKFEVSSGSNSKANDFDVGMSSESEGGDSSDHDNFDLSKGLADWALECKVTNVAMDKLLKLLHPLHPNLPLTYRSLLKTDVTVGETKKIGSGEYMHYGLLKGIMHHKKFITKLENSEVKYHVNIDGLPLFKSSCTQLWPIVGKIVGTQCMFLIGSYCGSTKPSSVGDYLQQFIDEAKKLASEGFTVDGRKFTASVMCYICDAPARAFIKQIKMHTGYNACERCTEKGEYIGGRMTYPSSDALTRNDEDFSLMKYEGHQHSESPLLELSVGLVSACILDSMHLIHLGVVRRLLKYWIRGPRSVKLSAHQVSLISEKLISLGKYIPCEFARKPRSLLDLDRWKASELRQFLLYTGVVALKSVLDDKLYCNFMNMSIAVFTLSSPALVEHYSDYSKSLLKFTVEECRSLYGQEFIVYNVHNLVHIAEDARKYGCLDSISSFPFENYLGQLKSIRKPQQILQQIFRRLSEGYHMSQCCNHLTTTMVKTEHWSGPVVAGLRHLKQYRQVQTGGYILKVHVPDNCVWLSNGKIGLIRNIFSDGNNISLVLQKFKKLSPAFVKPLLSTDIGIYFASDLSDSMDVCQLTDVCNKMVLLPAKYSGTSCLWIGIPLLHTAF